MMDRGSNLLELLSESTSSSKSAVIFGVFHDWY